MSNIVIQLEQKGLVRPPSWLSSNIHYLTIMGSHAYGVADTSIKDKIPDYDVYGWAIPPKNMIFTHLTGYIPGFGPEPPNFEQFQQHHILDKDALGGRGKEWDLTIYSIVKYFNLCRENNPNMMDSLFTPEECVIHCTQIGRMVRDNRRLFLSKLCWKKYRGYAHEQLKKCKNVIESKEIMDVWIFEKKHNIPQETRLSDIELAKTNKSLTCLAHLTDQELDQYHTLYQTGMSTSTRFENRKCDGQDSKFLYHILRLFDQAEQVLLEGDMNLQRSKEVMKAVRRGEWSIDQVQTWAIEKDKHLEAAYTSSKLPEKPPIEPLYQLLKDCLEQHFGSLDNCITQVDWAQKALKQLDDVMNSIRPKLYS